MFEYDQPRVRERRPADATSRARRTPSAPTRRRDSNHRRDQPFVVGVVVDPARVVEQLPEADRPAVRNEVRKPTVEWVVEPQHPLGGELEDERRDEGLGDASDAVDVFRADSLPGAQVRVPGGAARAPFASGPRRRRPATRPRPAPSRAAGGSAAQRRGNPDEQRRSPARERPQTNREDCETTEHALKVLRSCRRF